MRRVGRIAVSANLLLLAVLLPLASFGGQKQTDSSKDEMASPGAHPDEFDKDGMCVDKKLHDYTGWCAATAFPLKVRITAFAAQPQTADVGMQCHPNDRCDIRRVTLSTGQMVMTCLTNTLSCPLDTVFVLQAGCNTLTVPFYSRTKCAPLLLPADYQARSAVSGPGFEILLHTPDKHGKLPLYTYKIVGEEKVN
jgi:hypothetical protein